MFFCLTYITCGFVVKVKRNVDLFLKILVLFISYQEANFNLDRLCQFRLWKVVLRTDKFPSSIFCMVGRKNYVISLRMKQDDEG